MSWTIKQRREVKENLLNSIKQVNNYKGKGYKTAKISFPGGIRKSHTVTAKRDKESHNEGLYRNALITVWETPIKVIFSNIKYIRQEFKSDKQILLALDEIEKFFKKIRRK